MLIIFYILLDFLNISLKCTGHYDDVRCIFYITSFGYYLDSLLFHLVYFCFTSHMLPLYAGLNISLDFPYFLKRDQYCLALRSHCGTNVCKLLISVKQCRMELVLLFSRYVFVIGTYAAIQLFISMLVRV